MGIAVKVSVGTIHDPSKSGGSGERKVNVLCLLVGCSSTSGSGGSSRSRDGVGGRRDERRKAGE